MSHIIIDKSKCKACYLCINVCPKKLIKVSSETNNLGNKVVEFDDPQKQCPGCAVSAQSSPDIAITEVYKG